MLKEEQPSRLITAVETNRCYEGNDSVTWTDWTHCIYVAIDVLAMFVSYRQHAKIGERAFSITARCAWNQHRLPTEL